MDYREFVDLIKNSKVTHDYFERKTIQAWAGHKPNGKCTKLTKRGDKIAISEIFKDPTSYMCEKCYRLVRGDQWEMLSPDSRMIIFQAVLEEIQLIKKLIQEQDLSQHSMAQLLGLLDTTSTLNLMGFPVGVYKDLGLKPKLRSYKKIKEEVISHIISERLEEFFDCLEKASKDTSKAFENAAFHLKARAQRAERTDLMEAALSQVAAALEEIKAYELGKREAKTLIIQKPSYRKLWAPSGIENVLSKLNEDVEATGFWQLPAKCSMFIENYHRQNKCMLLVKDPLTLQELQEFRVLSDSYVQSSGLSLQESAEICYKSVLALSVK